MNDLVNQVLLEAWALSPDEHSLFTPSLLDSLEGENGEKDGSDTVTTFWMAEARRRNEDITVGSTHALLVETFRHWFNAL